MRDGRAHRRPARPPAPRATGPLITVRAFLGLGSNLGDRVAHLRGAVEALRAGPGSGPGIATSAGTGTGTGTGTTVLAVSDVYETDPVGGPEGQGPYLNLVVALETDRDPRQLLELARALEAAAGRVRTERWGPRTLDVDVLLVGDLRFDEPDLVVPHPRMSERRFVLAPLSDLAPELVAPDVLDRSRGGVRRLGPLDSLKS